MSADFTRLRGVAAYGTPLVSDLIEANVIAFLDWGLLGIGGFISVANGDPGSVLHAQHDDAFTDGQVWQGFRQDWVWEQNPDWPGASPVTQVTVDGTTQSLATAGASVDYAGGRLIFATPLPLSSSVSCSYSFRRVHLTTVEAEWFQEIEYGTLNTADDQLANFAKGIPDILARNRIQLPAVVIEAVTRVGLRGYELGTNVRIHSQDVVFRVFAENAFDRKQLHDLLIAQWQHRFFFFDKAAVLAAGQWPVLADGSPNPSGLSYPQLVDVAANGGFRWRLATVANARSEEEFSFPPLYRANVRLTLELDLP